MSRASKKRSPNEARARLSDILEEMEALTREFGQLSSQLGRSGDAVNTLYDATSDARALIGDTLDIRATVKNGADTWQVAAMVPRTRAQLAASLRELLEQEC